MQAALQAAGRPHAACNSSSSSCHHHQQQPSRSSIVRALPQHHCVAVSSALPPCVAPPRQQQQPRVDRRFLLPAAARRRTVDADGFENDESESDQLLGEFAEPPLDGERARLPSQPLLLWRIAACCHTPAAMHQQRGQTSPACCHVAHDSTDDSLRERQAMAAQAGPSYAGGYAAAAAAGGEDVGEDEDEELGEGELDDSPFPEPEPRFMLLCDLLGNAGEIEAAALVQQGERRPAVPCECLRAAQSGRGGGRVAVESATPSA